MFSFFLTEFYGILRNPTEFAFMKRFFMRMHVFLFLRNSTEFYGICIYEEILYQNACFPFLRNSTEFREYSLWEWMFLWYALIP